MEIESPGNANFKKFLSLTTNKGIKNEGLFLLSGESLVKEFLKDPTAPKAVAEIHTQELTTTSSLNSFCFSKKLFKQLDVIGTHFNILVVQMPKIQDWDPNCEPMGLELILPLGDPGNLGASLRSAEAMQVSKVILTNEAANPFLPKSVKASAGSAYRLQIFRGPSLAELPRELIALDGAGKNLLDFKWPQNVRLLVGEEGPGLGSFTPNQLIRIPTHRVESLNAVVATSLAMFHYRSQHRAN